MHHICTKKKKKKNLAKGGEPEIHWLAGYSDNKDEG